MAQQFGSEQKGKFDSESKVQGAGEAQNRSVRRVLEDSSIEATQQFGSEVEFPPPVICIDGPSGVGKGTLAKALATKLAWNYMDSGLLYRLLALQFVQNQDIDSLDFSKLKEQSTNSEQLMSQLRSEQCGLAAAQIATNPQLRQSLSAVQNSYRQHPGLVCDGRDMGSKIFPDAILKIFLTASSEAKAQRRAKQLGAEERLEEIISEMKERDLLDLNRSTSPLVKASDAIEINSDNLSAQEVLDKVLKLLKNII